MDSEGPPHPYPKPLYAKHKDTHPSKIGKGFFPDVILGSGSGS